ncbi:uncharacterized protein ACN2A1_002987 isoform 1-T2 [Glossina fuscipes fuscipes]
MDIWRIFLILLIKAHLSLTSNDEAPLLTQTIYGFLDFTTTIGNTVMVFSPQSAPPLVLTPEIFTPKPIIKTKPTDPNPPAPESDINPTKLKTEKPSLPDKEKPSSTIIDVKSSVTVLEFSKPLEQSSSSSPPSSLPQSSSPPSSSSSSPPPSLPTLSSSSPSPPPSPSPPSPSSLSSSLSLPLSSSLSSLSFSSSSSSTSSLSASSPIVSETKNSIVTAQVVDTSPIPIENDLYDPEYDLLSRQPPQFVEESFRVVNLRSPNSKNTKSAVVVTPEKNTASSLVIAKSSSTRSHHKNKKHKVRASSTLQVLKTAAPAIHHPKSSGTLSNKINHRTSSSSISSSSRKSNKKNSHRTASTPATAPEEVVTVRSTSSVRSKPKRKNKNKSSSSTSKPKYSISTVSATTAEPAARRAFRPKVQAQNPELESSNNLHITKLNRAPGRWQYKTSPKPRVTIRKPSIDINGPLGLANVTSSSFTTDATINDNINNNFIISNQTDLESSGSQNGAVVNNIDQEVGNGGKQKFFTETINVEISTPADFKDTYYEIATIKKPFIFQAGILKKTRYITVTSTIEKYLTPEPTMEPRNDDEPLTENILILSTKPDSLLSGSITTLPPLLIESDSDTPALETITESFSIVNKKLRTQILPIVKTIDNETIYHTLIQTIDMTSLITVTKTLSPQMESKAFNGFKDFVDNLDEAGSELNLDLEFGDESNHENSSGESNPKDLDQLMIVKPNKTNVVITTTSIEKFPSILNPTLPLPTVITNSRPVVKLETLWESYVIPVTNGQTTSFRTLSKAKGVVEKTDFILDTTTLSAPAILPPSTINPFLLPLQQQQFQTITSPIVQQTIVTQTESKILKLTFGAKTAYTTLYSTQVVPTLQTMYVTTSIPVQASANPFPGFFPQPYNPFAYLG